MTSSEGATATGNPQNAVDRRLRELVARGFQFIHPTDARGDVVAVVGIRVHGVVVDVVELRGADEVSARRIPAGERDVLAPTTVLWWRSGDACTVLDAMLDLDEFHGAARVPAPRDARGCWLSVKPGHQRWLAATA